MATLPVQFEHQVLGDRNQREFRCGEGNGTSAPVWCGDRLQHLRCRDNRAQLVVHRCLGRGLRADLFEEAEVLEHVGRGSRTDVGHLDSVFLGEQARMPGDPSLFDQLCGPLEMFP